MTGVLAAFVVVCLLMGAVPNAVLALLAAAAGAAALVGRHRHGGGLAVDVFARSSRLSAWNAPLKAGGCVTLLVLCVASPSPAPPMALAAALAAVTVLGGGLPLREYLALLRLPALFLLLSGLALLWDAAPAPEGVLWVPWFQTWLVVTVQAQETARLVMARALGAVSCLYFLSLSTPMPELLSVLRRLRVPAVMTELMVLIYRYIFVLLSAFYDMRAAAASRLGYGGLRQSLRTTGAVYGNLLAKSFRRASACFDAMESRCYDGEIRFLEEDAPVSVPAAALFALLAAAMGAAVLWSAI